MGRGLSFARHAVRASTLAVASGHGPAWTRAGLSGRLVELSAAEHAAPLTAAFGLVLDTQVSGDHAAWVALDDSSFFAPDVLDSGIDLEALPVVRVPDARTAGRAADHLVRSGGFGLVVIDLAVVDRASSRAGADDLATPLLTRLLGFAQHHDVVVLILTSKPRATASLHSLISVRAEAQWQPQGDGRYDVSIDVIKDKRFGPGWGHTEVCRGPVGLR